MHAFSFSSLIIRSTWHIEIYTKTFQVCDLPYHPYRLHRSRYLDLFFFSCQLVRKGDKDSEMMADMFTGLKTAPRFRTSRRLVLFPLGCIWKVGGAMAVTTRPASTETIKNFKVTKKIIIGSPCYKARMRSLDKS